VPSHASSVSISIILPVYNEQERIKRSTERILAFCKQRGWDFELIFVEDGSTDSTVELIRMMQSLDNRIRLLSFSSRLGKGGAIRAAAILAAEKEYMAYMDIDLAADPSELQRLLGRITKNDVVIGSRILRGNLPPIKRPFLRSLFSHLYSRFFRVLFRMPIYDPQCGFKLFRTKIVKELFNDVTIYGFAFDTELLLKAFTQNLRVEEVPIVWTHGTNSKISIIREIRSMGSDILSLWYYYHLLWRQHKVTYPNKKGSLYAKVLFVLLSLTTYLNPSWLTVARMPIPQSGQPKIQVHDAKILDTLTPRNETK
jgi:glycosyltransferase involved in cell wall biosynthesis